jgi:hypothetical protein
MPTLNKQELINTFAKLQPGSTFVSVREYKNNYNELSNFGLVFHIDYTAALKRSRNIIANYNAQDVLHREAKTQLLSSLDNRLANIIPIEDRDEPYTHFRDADGNVIKGIKAHEGLDRLYLFGFLVHKRVLVAGEYKDVNSGNLTLAKREIEKSTPIYRFRQFTLLPKSYREIAIEKLVIK